MIEITYFVHGTTTDNEQHISTGWAPGELNQHHESEFNPDPYWCINKRFPKGESYKDVEERISDFLDHLKINFDNKHVAIVAHKAPQLALDVLRNTNSADSKYRAAD